MTDALRVATARDALALLDLERAASLLALSDVFPPDEFPYPDAAVLDRWRRTLAEPGVHVLVSEDEGGLTSFVAFDAVLVRHLAVRPDRWGTGLARRALAAARAVANPARLWCLRDNHRAIGLYEHLGWTRTGREQPAPYPPFPTEIELAAPDDQA